MGKGAVRDFIAAKGRKMVRVFFGTLLLAATFFLCAQAKAEAEERRKAGFSNDVGASIEVTIEGAILMALENNRALRVERLNPDILRTFENQEQAVFDPLLRGNR